jgi:hypothetical protein
MEPADELVSRGWCLAKEGEVYAVYMPEGGEAELELDEGTYKLSWYDPRKGGEPVEGGKLSAKQAGKVKIGPAPTKEDWAAVITVNGKN